jgi:hypothetical protein
MKNGFWGNVKDFIADSNGTSDIHIKVGEMPYQVGGVGPRPDVAAMANEPIDLFDCAADKLGLDGRQRLIHRDLWNRLRNVDRINLISAQAAETASHWGIPIPHGWLKDGEESRLHKKIMDLVNQRKYHKTAV